MRTQLAGTLTAALGDLGQGPNMPGLLIHRNYVTSNVGCFKLLNLW
jgi:hypothetical protein